MRGIVLCCASLRALQHQCNAARRALGNDPQRLLHINHPINAPCPADAGRGFRTAKQRDQTIVPPAGDHRILCAKGGGGEFKNHPAVIIQAAHQTRGYRIWHPSSIEAGLHRFPMGAAFRTEQVQQLRRAFGDRAVGRMLGIKDAKGILVQAALGISREL